MADVDAHSSSDLDPAESDGELTSGDFGEVSDEGDAAFCSANETLKDIPCNEVINTGVETSFDGDVQLRQKKATSTIGSYSSLNDEDELFNVTKISNGNDDISIVGILGKDHGIAEARLAARRQARAEARDIRMRELERQQKEQEENADRAYYMQSEPLQRSTRVSGSGPAAIARLSSTTSASGTPNAHSSRRSSQDSVEELGSIRDIRHELKEVEEKFRKAMILNAQLDNDKASFSYQLELLKDKLEDLQEQYTQLQREHKDKCRSHEALVRECRVTKEEVERCTAAVALRDRCILEAGLELVAVQLAEGDTEGAGAALVSRASKEALEAAGHGALDVRLQTLCSQRQALESEVKQLKIQLDEERSKKKNNIHNNSSHNGPVNGSDSDSDSMENHRENSKLVADYKFRASKAEQDVLTLQATVARLESQVIRYKSAVDEAERMEDELKCDRRKLQREAREAQSRVEELETENNHLNKRLDKLKTAKSALLKEL